MTTSLEPLFTPDILTEMQKAVIMAGFGSEAQKREGAQFIAQLLSAHSIEIVAALLNSRPDHVYKESDLLALKMKFKKREELDPKRALLELEMEDEMLRERLSLVRNLISAKQHPDEVPVVQETVSPIFSQPLIQMKPVTRQEIIAWFQSATSPDQMPTGKRTRGTYLGANFYHPQSHRYINELAPEQLVNDVDQTGIYQFQDQYGHSSGKVGTYYGVLNLSPKWIVMNLTTLDIFVGIEMIGKHRDLVHWTNDDCKIPLDRARIQNEAECYLGIENGVF